MSDWAVFGNVMGPIISLLTLAVMLRKFANGAECRTIAPQPLEVREAKEFAAVNHEHPKHLTAEQMEARCALRHASFEASIGGSVKRIEDHVLRIEADVKNNNTQDEIRAAKLHTRLNGLSDEWHEMKGEMKSLMREGVTPP